MSRFFQCIAIALLTLSVFYATAQPHAKRSNYQLLWQISGNGLKAPSYLFGTMHVYDNRAFDFSDSVLLKISACKAFALEVHPDSAVSMVINKMLQPKNKKNQFKELLNPDDYKYLDSLLTKKTGYTLEGLKSPAVAEIILERSNYKKDKSTFVDVYLYNIARKQGKIILGLENMEDQLSALDEKSPSAIKENLISYLDNVDSVKRTVNYKNLIDLYYQGDIGEIRNVMKNAYSNNPLGYEKLITQRNIGMVESMKREMALHSMFAAVGVGHLAGEEGMITLLRKSGYTVTRVAPKFTGLAKKYKYTAEPENWYKYSSTAAGYTIDMPFKPKALTIDSLGLTFQMSIDLGTATLYQVTYIPTHNSSTSQSAKQILDAFEQRMRKIKSNKVEKHTDIIVEGLPAREFVMLKGSSVFKVRLILRGNLVYMIMVGDTRQAINSDDARKFLTSFKTIPFPMEEWKEFSDKKGAFKVNMWGEVKSKITDAESADVEGQRYHLNIFFSFNAQKQETYIMRYNDFPIGYISQNDTTYYNATIDASYQQLKGYNLRKKEVLINGFKGCEFTYGFGDEGVLKGQVVLRGNRLYLTLITTSKNITNSGAEEFMRSLRFTDYQLTALQPYAFPEQGITLKLPSLYETDSTDDAYESKRRIYNAIDANSGVPFLYAFDEFSDYEQYADKEAYFKDLNMSLEGETDSLISIKDISSKDYIGQEVLAQSTLVNTIKRVRTVINGKKIYQLFAYLPADYNSELKDEFFNSLLITKKDTWSLFTDKTDFLLKDLSSPDTITQQAAETGLIKHVFKQADIPRLYKALKTVYPDDGLDEHTSVKYKLLGKLAAVHDSTTISFIKDFYLKLPDSSKLQSRTLSVLSGMKTKAATAQLISLLKNDIHTKDFNTYSILTPYYDSLALVAPVITDLVELESRFSNLGYIFGLAKLAIDSGAVTGSQKETLIRSLIELGTKKTAPGVKVRKTDDHYYEVKEYWYELANALSSVPLTNEVKNVLLAIHKSNDPGIMIMTTPILIKNNIKVDQKDLEKIVLDPVYRLTLYEKLSEIGKETLFPARYFTAQKRAESALVEYMEYDDESAPDQIEYVTTKLIRHKEQEQNLFVFKYKYNGSDDWYIGASGPYPIKSNEPLLRGDIVFLTYDVYTKTTDLNSVISAELKNYEAELIR